MSQFLEGSTLRAENRQDGRPLFSSVIGSSNKSFWKWSFVNICGIRHSSKVNGKIFAISVFFWKRLLQISEADAVSYICKKISLCKSLISSWSKGFGRLNNFTATSVQSTAGKTSEGEFEKSYVYEVLVSCCWYDIKFEYTATSIRELFLFSRIVGKWILDLQCVFRRYPACYEKKLHFVTNHSLISSFPYSPVFCAFKCLLAFDVSKLSKKGVTSSLIRQKRSITWPLPCQTWKKTFWTPMLKSLTKPLKTNPLVQAVSNFLLLLRYVIDRWLFEAVYN